VCLTTPTISPVKPPIPIFERLPMGLSWGNTLARYNVVDDEDVGGELALSPVPK
jgi:hypothetical protein